MGRKSFKLSEQKGIIYIGSIRKKYRLYMPDIINLSLIEIKMFSMHGYNFFNLSVFIF